MHFCTGLHKCDLAKEEIWKFITNLEEFSIYRGSGELIESCFVKNAITGSTQFTSHYTESKIFFLLISIGFKYQGSLVGFTLQQKAPFFCAV